MTSLRDLRFSPPPNSKSRLCLRIKPCAICIPDTDRGMLVLLTHHAKQQNICCIASSLKFLWYGSMEWNMEENFSMVWNMEENFSMKWKIFGMEWKWNERKLPVWNMEKSSSIPYHALATTTITSSKTFATSSLRFKQFFIWNQKPNSHLQLEPSIPHFFKVWQ